MATERGRGPRRGCTARESRTATAAQQQVAADGPLRGPPLNLGVRRQVSLETFAIALEACWLRSTLG
jgi:hypothetical protein